MKRLTIFNLICLVLAAFIFLLKGDDQSTNLAGVGLVVNKAWLVENKNVQTPEPDKRPADQTFLTYPEWFLVFSPVEQADYYQSHTSTTFPIIKHIHQVWDGYEVVSDQIEEDFEYNDDYHTMIKVISISTTIEYGLKAWYEKIVGRVTDTHPHEALTEEDQFNGKFTRDYSNFLGAQPWYEFDFTSRLISLWTETSFFGPHLMRKAERRYFLTTELLCKIAYAKLIKMGTQSMYEKPVLTTVIVLDKSPEGIKGDSAIEEIGKTEGGDTIVRVPRYAEFTPAAVQLAKAGLSFKEIAGNNSAILLTVLTPQEYKFKDETVQVIFEQLITTKENQKRVAVVTTVPHLSALLVQLVDNNITIEHIYDY
ncbi:hypothetical protein [Gimesia aquarii]|uniref:Uncharacterized protein n=1 Tax=Gimesia aquarii TaxID=2527964 RepID=A0A517W1X3_9PLAN|nr:hypothetical protein [Gimesia aquarii]QDT99248.1 hypothetical protein V144x_47590 [Gimesia aquarii]